jgi:hypothetical protein
VQARRTAVLPTVAAKPELATATESNVMGSRGQKRTRKGKPRTHLPKVGTRSAVRAEQHRERGAIADTMGFGRTPAWVRWTALFVGAMILIGGVVTLVALA